eukprot:SAG22_NODE_1169_length_5270_cov_15.228969_1_plen_73_part_10
MPLSLMAAAQHRPALAPLRLVLLLLLLHLALHAHAHGPPYMYASLDLPRRGRLQADDWLVGGPGAAAAAAAAA